MAARSIACLLIATFAAASPLAAQSSPAVRNPRVDHRLASAAEAWESSLVVLWANRPHRAIDVAADLGLHELRGLDDWAAGQADPAALRRLVSDPRVRFARPPFAAEPASNGIPLTGAPAQHALDNRGAGTKICVIDTEFGQYGNAVAAGHIPANITTMSFSGAGFDTGGNHGTSCLKIVHEMAPQAQLYTALVYYDIDIQLASAWAVSQGCHVVSGSFSMTLGNYWGAAGDLVQAGVANLHAAGVLPVFAAGNQGERHHDAYFTDANASGYMDWPGHGDSLPVNILAGPNLITITWNAWPDIPVDYDAEIVDSAGNVIFESTNSQTGTQPPYEILYWNGGALPGHRLRIKLMGIAAGTPHPQINLQVWSNTTLPPSARKRNGSITLPAAIPQTLAVGAIQASSWPTGVTPSYSGFGPCYEDPSLAKPDLAAPTGVLDPYYGVFTGTSASCPHVAGAAALFLALEPGLAYVPGALKSFVLSFADTDGLPMANQPFEFGQGRLAIPPVLLDGYLGVCALTPTTPTAGETVWISVAAPVPFSPVTLVADPVAIAPLTIGDVAIHVLSGSVFPLVDGFALFGAAPPATLGPNGLLTTPMTRPPFALGVYGVRLQAVFAVGGTLMVTTPAILDV